MTEAEVDARCAAMLRRFGEALKPRFRSDATHGWNVEHALATLPQEREPQRQERCAGFGGRCLKDAGHTDVCEHSGTGAGETQAWRESASRTQASQSAAAEHECFEPEFCSHGAHAPAAPPAPGARPLRHRPVRAQYIACDDPDAPVFHAADYDAVFARADEQHAAFTSACRQRDEWRARAEAAESALSAAEAKARGGA